MDAPTARAQQHRSSGVAYSLSLALGSTVKHGIATNRHPASQLS